MIILLFSSYGDRDQSFDPKDKVLPESVDENQKTNQKDDIVSEDPIPITPAYSSDMIIQKIKQELEELKNKNERDEQQIKDLEEYLKFLEKNADD